MNSGARTTLTLTGAATAALIAASVVEFAPMLVWNASASAPMGLYSTSNRAPAVGDYVLVSPPLEQRKLIELRGYLPPETPLLKRVAAVSDAQICRDANAIFIDGFLVARALETDSEGRELPRWSGCIELRPGEVFLLNDHERSLDGRYFGKTEATEIIGVARPILTQKPDAVGSLDLSRQN